MEKNNKKLQIMKRIKFGGVKLKKVSGKVFWFKSVYGYSLEYNELSSFISEPSTKI